MVMFIRLASDIDAADHCISQTHLPVSSLQQERPTVGTDIILVKLGDERVARQRRNKNTLSCAIAMRAKAEFMKTTLMGERCLLNRDRFVISQFRNLNIKTEQTNIFFKLMEERHHRRPTLISTNLPFAAWQDFLGNPALTKALLSRVRERCHTFIIDGPCLRPQTG